jgi:hypothetical protein
MEWDQQLGRFRWTVESLVDLDTVELGQRAAVALYFATAERLVAELRR